jgi:hypothetical protein
MVKKNINNVNNNSKKKDNNKSNESIDKKISECVKKCNIFDIEKSNDKKSHFESKYPTEKSYQESFDDVISFSKSLTEKEKESIDIVIYNANNNDGLMSGYISWLYLTEKNKNKDIKYIPGKPASSNNILNIRLKQQESVLKGKTLLIMDISFGKANIEYLSKVCKEIIVIDDHKIETNNNMTKFIKKYDNIKAFIGDTHSACAYTWKFFFPRKDVPFYVMVSDNKDKKLFLPFLSRTQSQYITSYISFRITNNPSLNENDPNYFKKVHELLDIDPNFASLVGKYYDEVENNIKDQVAKNARKANFQGHPVYVLNYNDPVLYKKVARQMVTNAEKKGEHIDFAVLWGYEYTSNSYKIFLSEKHEGKPKFNLPNMAKQLAKIGGSVRGGLGKDFVGNFYWPHNNKYDIWDLFTHKYV